MPRFFFHLLYRVYGLYFNGDVSAIVYLSSLMMMIFSSSFCSRSDRPLLPTRGDRDPRSWIYRGDLLSSRGGEGQGTFLQHFGLLRSPGGDLTAYYYSFRRVYILEKQKLVTLARSRRIWRTPEFVDPPVSVPVGFGVPILSKTDSPTSKVVRFLYHLTSLQPRTSASIAPDTFGGHFGRERKKKI